MKMRLAADAAGFLRADPGDVIARLPKLSFVLSILVAVSAIYLAVPGTAEPARARTATTVELTTLDQGVLLQLNAIRRLHNLTPLTIDASLNRSASQHSVEMGLK